MWKQKDAVAPSSAVDLPQQLRTLQEQLAVREQEVAALREIAEAASQLQSQDVQAAKIIELSKKNRSLNLSLEKEKHKVAKLQQALSQTLQAQPASTLADSKAATATDEHQQELAAVKERVQQMTNRMGQMEQKVFLLETENKKLTRALLREVGDGIPLAKLLEEGSGSDWKGRREQMIKLHDTIRQLKEAAAAGGDAAAGPTGSAGPSSSLAKHETAHRNVIGKLNKQKDTELQRMAAELEAAKAATEALRLKYTGASSRRKVLEEEVAGLKDKLSVVLGKTQNDDKLIAALRKELVAATHGKAGASRVPGPVDADSSSSSFELSQQRCTQLEEQVEQQQKVIRYLQAQADGSKGAAAGPQQQLQLDNERLRQQLAVLQLDAAAGGGGVSALQQQVLLLQEENMQMREQLSLRQAGKPALHLTSSDFEVLEAAKEAVVEGAVGDELEGIITRDEAEEEGAGEEAEEEAGEEAEGEEEEGGELSGEEESEDEEVVPRAKP